MKIKAGESISERLKTEIETKSNLYKCRADLQHFIYTLGKDDKGNALVQNEFTELLLQVVRACHAERRWLSIVAPPGLGKSTLVRLYILWALGKDPTLKSVITGAEKSKSQDAVAFCREIVSSKEYSTIFPEVVPDYYRNREEKAKSKGWQKDKFYLRSLKGAQSPDPALEAVSGIPLGLGRRISGVLFLDDFMSQRVACSNELRERHRDAFHKGWVDRISNDGWLVAVQNCWMNLDLGHELKSRDDVCSLWVGVQESKDGLFARLYNPPAGLDLSEYEGLEPADGADAEFYLPLPELPGWGSEEIEKKAQEPYWEQKYLLRALSADSLMFPGFSQRQSKGETVQAQLGLPVGNPKGLLVLPPDLLSKYVICGGMDLSGASRKGTVLCFWAKDENGFLFPLEYHIGSLSSISPWIELIDGAWHRGLRFRQLNVERTGLQNMFLLCLREFGRDVEWASRLHGFETGENKMDPVVGLPAINAKFESGRINWPTGEAKHYPHWKRVENDFLTCPRFLTNRTTPDTVMASYFALSALDKFSVRRSFIPMNVKTKLLSRGIPGIQGGW